MLYEVITQCANTRLSVFTATSEEYGDVLEKKIIVKTATDDFIFDLPADANNWQTDLIPFLQNIFSGQEMFLDQWVLIRAEMQTYKTYSEPGIYRADSVNFYSYTNPVWLKINSPDHSPVFAQDFGFKVFPNPANCSVEVKLSSQEANGKISVINSVGQVAFEYNICGDTGININSLEPGVYFVKFESAEVSVTEKLIVY